MLRTIALAGLAAALATTATAQDCGEGQRRFAQPEGETCIPETPQRIAARGLD